MDVKKTAIVGGCILGGAIIIGAGCYYIRLYNIYHKVSSISEAQALIASPNNIYINLPDASLDSDMTTALQNPDSSGYCNNGSDNIDAVSINDMIYTGDSNTAIYYDSNSDTYNGNTDTMTDINGNVTAIDPNTVVYGTLDSDGVFIQD